MATFRQVQLKATGTLPSTSTVKTKSIEFRRSDSSSSVEAEDACNKGKHSAPISALIIPSNPEERKYKERIGDGSSPVEPLCLPFVLVTAQQQQQQQETNEEQENAIRELQENFNMTDFRAKLRVAEALAQASDMTSPAARRRLEARKIEMDLTQDQHEGSKVPPPVFLNDQNEEYTPPRELLIYIMR